MFILCLVSLLAGFTSLVRPPYQADMAPYQANTHRYQAVSWRRETTLMTMTSEVQERMRRQARLAFAEPQPSLAMHLQMHCKETKNRGAMQAFSNFISDFSEMLNDERSKSRVKQIYLLELCLARRNSTKSICKDFCLRLLSSHPHALTYSHLCLRIESSPNIPLY